MCRFCLDDVLNLAGHEIYPGHHVHLGLLDRRLVQEKGWVEFTVLPLHSPLALVCEGLAVYGSKELIGSAGDEFERTVLYPLAGLDPAQAREYGRVMALKDELDIAKIKAARRYLDGRMDRTQTRRWLCDYCLVTPGAAENLIQFIEQYRTYIVNYTLGRRLVANYIESRCGNDQSPERRWRLFRELLSMPVTPSQLAREGDQARAPRPRLDIWLQQPAGFEQTEYCYAGHAKIVNCCGKDSGLGAMLTPRKHVLGVPK